MTDEARSPHTVLGDGAEFETIRDLLKRWGATASGIGDDAAVVDVPRGERVVVSVDAFVAGRHFEPSWLTATEIGYRATTAALSDLAAMAALPLGILFAVNVPDDWRAKLPQVAEGVAMAAREARTVIIGGNLSAADELSITTTVLGHAFRPLARVGANVGEHVYVTGRLGGPGAAVSAWKSGGQPSAEVGARFVHPVARIREARWLADRGATAAIDISDGLVADAGHLAAASERHIELHLDRLQTVAGVGAVDAAASGEEYELLVSAPRLDVDAFGAAFGIPLTDIGEVIEGEAGVTAMTLGIRVAAVAGHDHFSG
jgi:thiamine-monophosphate kinase